MPKARHDRPGVMAHQAIELATLRQARKGAPQMPSGIAVKASPASKTLPLTEYSQGDNLAFVKMGTAMWVLDDFPSTSLQLIHTKRLNAPTNCRKLSARIGRSQTVRLSFVVSIMEL